MGARVGQAHAGRASVKEETVEKLYALADSIAADIIGEEAATADAGDVTVDNKAFFKITYGLFVLTSGDKAKKGGCIVNTVIQVTDTPKRISVAVNKANYTCELINKTGVFNACVIDEDADFKLFQDFGFRSGRDVDKFAGRDDVAYAANGLPYINKACNAFISVCKVCGYVYEGDTLPEDFVCPWCKHGASDFEPLK